MKIKEYIKELPTKLLGDENRKIIRLFTYVALGIVSVFMTIVNMFTSEWILGISTGIFAVLCLLSYISSKLFKKGDAVAEWIFAVGVIGLFTFFIVFGYPNGFSIIWIALMAPIALLFYGAKKGSIITGVMFIILVFFLWIPFGQNLISNEAVYHIYPDSDHCDGALYASTFRLRFPFLCIGSYVLALILELTKDLAFKELKRINKINAELSIHDPLTGLYNRTGMRQAHERYEGSKDFEKGYFIIFDIDHFKDINDNYGHLAGDSILQQIAEIMKNNMKGIYCRYGGDEFSAFLTNNDYDIKDLENLIKLVEEHKFSYQKKKNIHVTISMGIFEATLSQVSNSDECLRLADIALYKSKNGGRNRLTIY